MSLRLTIFRYSLILNKLRRQKCASFTEIYDYLRRAYRIRGEDLTISKRTFTRDIAAIGEIYGTYIKFNFSAQNYFIEEELDTEIDNRRLEALDIFNALKIKERQAEHILLDSRQANGTAHLFDLLHVINNRFQITFDYQIYDSEEAVERLVNLSARYKLFVPSNHDLPFEIEPEHALSYLPEAITCIKQGGIDWEGIRLFVLPARMGLHLKNSSAFYSLEH
jgi:hypothetical protein